MGKKSKAELLIEEIEEFLSNLVGGGLSPVLAKLTELKRIIRRRNGA